MRHCNPALCSCRAVDQRLRLLRIVSGFCSVVWVFYTGPFPCPFPMYQDTEHSNSSQKGESTGGSCGRVTYILARGPLHWPPADLTEELFLSIPQILIEVLKA